uniref:Protein kinase domain-containing protein n=1 Tax=Panagrellus redivivus TaxID=6233 RepID=A0A7E4UWU2_PANRE
MFTRQFFTFQPALTPAPITLTMSIITKADLPLLPLLTYPYVHFHLVDSDLQKALKAVNDFLINIDADSKLWLVFRRHDDAILFHEIQTFEDQGLQHYAIDAMTPQVKLEDVLEIVMTQFHENPETGIPIERAVCRRENLGSAKLPSLTGKFGFGLTAKVDVKSFGFAGTFFLRALDYRLAAKASFDDLEKLTSARHENICAVLDYFCEDGVVLLTENFEVSLDRYMDKNEPFAMSFYVKWVYQLFHGLLYLLESNFICERLSIRDLLLTPDGSIKVSDFWPTNFKGGATLSWLRQPGSDAPSLRPGTAGHRDHWRTTAPEVLRGHTISELTVSYSFAAVAWQIFTHNKLPFRLLYASEMDYLKASPATDDAFFPGMGLTDFNLRPVQVKNAVRGAMKSLQCLPTVPEKLRKTLFQCLQYDPTKRPCFSEVNSDVADANMTYYMIHKVDSLLSRSRNFQ